MKKKLLLCLIMLLFCIKFTFAAGTYKTMKIDKIGYAASSEMLHLFFVGETAPYWLNSGLKPVEKQLISLLTVAMVNDQSVYVLVGVAHEREIQQIFIVE